MKAGIKVYLVYASTACVDRNTYMTYKSLIAILNIDVGSQWQPHGKIVSGKDLYHFTSLDHCPVFWYRIYFVALVS